MRTDETYLGDGLYASFDGYMIRLRAPRMEGDHWVGLEPKVLTEFMKFAATCWPSLMPSEGRIKEGGEHA